MKGIGGIMKAAEEGGLKKEPSPPSHRIEEDDGGHHNGEGDGDDEFDWEVSEEYLKELREKYNDKEFPLFMDELPAEISSNDDLLALQQLVYDENDSPATIAGNFKDHGNSFFREGARGHGNAIACYTKGLEAQCGDKALDAVLLSNRANVYLMRRSYVECVEDCRRAIALDRQNIKAYYRAAKASLEMELFHQASKFAAAGLKMSAATAAGQNDALKRLFEESERKAEERRVAKTRAAASATKMSRVTARALQEALEERGIKKVVSSSYNVGLDAAYGLAGAADLPKPLLDEEGKGVLHWPLMFLYPEKGQSDFVQRACEDDKILRHLQTIFPGGDDFAPWDRERRYSWEALQLYFEPVAGEETSSGKQVVYSLGDDVTIRRLVDLGGGVVSVPLVFHALVRNSAAEKHFVETHAVVEALRS